MPANEPCANVMECQAIGEKVVKLNSLISDCGKDVAERKDREGWYDVSTLKEHSRIAQFLKTEFGLWITFK